ncbi:MAG: hypothetical protein LWX07_12775 [Bacteroidetes bacterium]|nr:hypothetical protein [Bacteroidota bacterium]
MMMNSALYINVFSSVVSIVMGVLLIGGIVLPQIETMTRMIFGLVFLAYGIYRMLNVQAKLKSQRQQEEHARLKKAQDEIIRKLKDQK